MRTIDDELEVTVRAYELRSHYDRQIQEYVSGCFCCYYKLLLLVLSGLVVFIMHMCFVSNNFDDGQKGEHGFSHRK